MRVDFNYNSVWWYQFFCKSWEIPDSEDHKQLNNPVFDTTPSQQKHIQLIIEH